MPIQRSLPSLALACLLAIFCGCASAPHAATPGSSNASAGSASGYNGWLFNSVTGRDGKSTEGAKPIPEMPNPQAAPGGVQQASAWTSPPEEVGPLVPGPSTSAGPPPTIPAALPPPPSGAISISSVKLKEEEKKGFDISDLSPDKVYANIKKATGYGPDEKIAHTAMDDGKSLFREKKYKEAADQFAKAAARWPDSPQEEDALFLEGESEFFSNQYSKAHDTFAELLKKYSNTRHLDTVMAREFAIGRYWEQLYTAKPTWPVTPNFTDKERPMFDTFGWAVKAYETIRLYDPKGPWADASLMALGNSYFLRGQWGDAAYNYDLLCKEYPQSKYQLKAHLFALQANMRRYQGSEYDEGPLKESGKIAKTTLTQFGNQLGSERDKVITARAQIEEEKANRDFIRGEYYRKRHCYGSARQYYNGVVQDFPATETARKAKEQLEAIRNEPDEPPALFQSLFGGKKK